LPIQPKSHIFKAAKGRLVSVAVAFRFRNLGFPKQPIKDESKTRSGRTFLSQNDRRVAAFPTKEKIDKNDLKALWN